VGEKEMSDGHSFFKHSFDNPMRRINRAIEERRMGLSRQYRRDLSQIYTAARTGEITPIQSDDAKAALRFRYRLQKEILDSEGPEKSEDIAL
jgi:membrane protein YdbS with pleckstrin-like domain